MKPSQRYRLNRLASILVTPERFSGNWFSTTVRLPPNTVVMRTEDFTRLLRETEPYDLRAAVTASNLWPLGPLPIPPTRSPLERE